LTSSQISQAQQFLAQMTDSYSYKLVKVMSVRVDVYQGVINCNRCTQRLAILHAQTC